MSSRLPSVKPREAVKAFKKLGYLEDHQRDSHLVLRHPDTRIRLVIPMHPGDIKKWLLRREIRKAGLTVEDFLELL